MENEAGAGEWTRRMREDWDERARRDAEGFIYTRDSGHDLEDFDASGRANFLQLVRPYLPVLLNGRDPKHCRALEIGCGVGRMTRWFSECFGEVEAVDVSPEMVRLARERLAFCSNLRLYEGSGCDLRPFSDGRFDLVFSYIVFQHIPSKEAIESYVHEASRVLRPGGAFKFQLNGKQPRAHETHAPDTWCGETFTPHEAFETVRAAGLEVIAHEGPGTQYFLLTTVKGCEPESGPRAYVLPGEEWSAAQLISGWGEPADRSWRPMDSVSELLLRAPRGGRLRFYAGLYQWSDAVTELTLRAGGSKLGSASLPGRGDHYIEISCELTEGIVHLHLTLEPAPAQELAFRCAGLYSPGS